MSRYVVLQELISRESHRVGLPCVFGRGKDVDLPVPDATISHRHALLYEAEDRIWIQDLDSLNGVFVNEQKVHEKARLQYGDLVRLGQVEFKLLQLEEDPTVQTVIMQTVRTQSGLELDRQRLNLIYEIAVELAENQDQTVLGKEDFFQLQRHIQARPGIYRSIPRRRYA